jgi:uracil-DNA glycosylase
MLASQAALCLLTGSLEMLVFHTLSAGNIGHFGAPGTMVVMTGAAVAAWRVVALTAVVPGRAAAASGSGRAVAASAAPPDVPACVPVLAESSVPVGAAAHPATQAVTAAAAKIPRPPRTVKCRVSLSTVASWHECTVLAGRLRDFRPARPPTWPPADAVKHRHPGGRRPLQWAAMAARSLSELVAPDWAEALQPVAAKITELGEFLRAEIAAGRSYLPAGDNILRAFRQPMADVRVLIVGQDPYPTPGHPVGLSFSVAAGIRRLPGSLVNIFKEYSTDLGFPQPSTGDLTPWSERGVMLLNRVLTVQPGSPGSHRGKGWEQVTEQAISALAARGGPLVAILWGNDARNLAPLLGDAPSIQSAHPSPMSADRGFFGSRPFSRADTLLEQRGAQPMDWKLP